MSTAALGEEGKQLKRIVSCRLPVDLIEDLNEIAHQEGFPRSQLIRQMLRGYVEYLRHDEQVGREQVEA